MQRREVHWSWSTSPAAPSPTASTAAHRRLCHGATACASSTTWPARSSTSTTARLRWCTATCRRPTCSSTAVAWARGSATWAPPARVLRRRRAHQGGRRLAGLRRPLLPPHRHRLQEVRRLQLRRASARGHHRLAGRRIPGPDGGAGGGNLTARLLPRVRTEGWTGSPTAGWATTTTRRRPATWRGSPSSAWRRSRASGRRWRRCARPSRRRRRRPSPLLITTCTMPPIPHDGYRIAVYFYFVDDLLSYFCVCVFYYWQGN